MQQDPASITCAVVVVTHNGCHLLEEFLPSVVRAAERAARPTRIYVVDNASTDGTVAVLQREFPAVRIISNPDNRFWAGGNNDGAHAAIRECPNLEWLVFLNNDVEVAEGFVEAITTTPAEHPDVGVVGVKAVFWHRFVPLEIWHGVDDDGGGRRGTLELAIDGMAARELDRVRTEFPRSPANQTLRIDRTGQILAPLAPGQSRFALRFTHLAEYDGRVFVHVRSPSRHWVVRLGVHDTQTLELDIEADELVTLVNNAGSWVDAAAGQAGDIGFDAHDRGQFDAPRLVDAVCGVAMGVSVELFSNLQGFDESYGLYYEDTDFSMRAGLVGKRCWYNPATHIRHLHSATSRAGSDFWRRQVMRSSLIFRRRFQASANPKVIQRELRERAAHDPLVAGMLAELDHVVAGVRPTGAPPPLKGRALLEP